MIVSRVRLSNWRNFPHVNVEMPERVFLVGPNASGKSNFLDVFRFLRDIAKPGGGLQKAVSDRGGVSKIRCLAARKYPDIKIEIELSSGQTNENSAWSYALAFKGARSDAYLTKEEVYRGKERVLQRPTPDDRNDPPRLTQTALEQITTNRDFREIADFFREVRYLHLIPQIIRDPEGYTVLRKEDPYGSRFLEAVAGTNKRTREFRLNLIARCLKAVVPQFRELQQDRDETGIPHLVATYEHWRPHGSKQHENQFSDGTLRLIGLLWSLLDGNGLLLLEEPEMSLHDAVVRQLASMIHRLQRRGKRQVIISTHSAELLSDAGIGGEETLALFPENEGTKVIVAADFADIREMLAAGITIGEAVLPRTAPKDSLQLDFGI